MPNQQLLDYIKQQLEQGIDREQIRQTLLNNGWQNVDIESAFSEISGIKPPKAERKWKKVLLTTIIGLVAAVVVIFFSFPYILNLFAKDIPPIDDSDLQLQKVYVPENENAYYDLIKLKDVVYEPSDRFQTISDMIKGKIWDEALARELISKNAKTFEYFSQAAQKPRFQDPALADPAKITPSVEIPNLASWRSATRLTVLKAFDLQRQGKTSEALDELEKVLEISKKINNSQANTLELLTALDIESQILESIQKVISSSRLDNTQLKQRIQKLGEYGENRTSFISALLKSEYKDSSFYMDSFTKLRNGENVKYSLPEFSEEELEKLKNKLSDPVGKYYFQPNKTKRLVAEFAREQIKNAESICYNQNSKSEMIKNRFPNNQVSAFFRENLIGETLASLLMLQLQVAFNKKCLNDTIFSATQTLIAIKAYKNDTGNYPASLNDLVPNYLTSLPKDPFDGKPLKYSASKKIIYSVGPDGQDSGGSSGDNLREMPDPTLQIEF